MVKPRLRIHVVVLSVFALVTSVCLSVYEDDRALGLPAVVWMGPVLAGGGYSSEALSYVAALAAEYTERHPDSERFGVREFAEHEDMAFFGGLPSNLSHVVQHAFKVGSLSKWDVAICHSTPDVWHADGAFGWGRAQPCPPPGARVRIGRTMYETDRLPAEWVPRINRMHEVWVPSQWAVAQFVDSGVHPQKIVVVPEAVDVDLFDPSKHQPLPLAHQPGDFVFLSVFKWEKRKGWDLLFKAFFEEFSADDPVVLYVKTQAFHSDNDFEAHVLKFASELPSARKPLARHALLDVHLPMKELPRLYRAADAFVLPSRGEGWGRPHVEAMSMGLPVIATNWSGSTEFLSDCCSLPLPVDGLSLAEGVPEGHHWADPSIDHLRSLMRWSAEHREEAKSIGRRARERMVTHFSPRVVVQTYILPRLLEHARQLKSWGQRARLDL